jgi:transcriptional regulator
MYIPDAFRGTDRERISALIEERGFATLLTVIDGQPFATHLPLLYAAREGRHGTLYGHVARPNPQAATFDGATPALAIFHGPHAYVSPTWYATPGVPTWNYAAVHVRGVARRIDDAARTLDLLERLVAKYDPPVADPDGPSPHAIDWTKMLPGIVGFEIEVESIEAKFKLSQNRPAADRQRVLARLGQTDSADAQEIAAWMLQDLAAGR